MQNQDLKSKVLEEIMSLMDQNDGERLKSHPKLMAAKVEVEKTQPGVDPIDGGGPESGELEEEVSPEMLQKLLDMIKE